MCIYSSILFKLTICGHRRMFTQSWLFSSMYDINVEQWVRISLVLIIIVGMMVLGHLEIRWSQQSNIQSQSNVRSNTQSNIHLQSNIPIVNNEHDEVQNYVDTQQQQLDSAFTSQKGSISGIVIFRTHSIKLHSPDETGIFCRPHFKMLALGLSTNDYEFMCVIDNGHDPQHIIGYVNHNYQTNCFDFYSRTIS